MNLIVRRSLVMMMAVLQSVVLAACASAPRLNYDEYVWPPPPDPPRIRLDDVVYGRSDILAKSGLQQILLGASPQGPYDWLKRPFAVEFDSRGRLFVTDSGLGALFRFDRDARQADVFGTRGGITLKTPLGLDVGRDGAIYVADAGLKRVVTFGPDGGVRGVLGREGDLDNPTDVAVSPDGSRLYVTDSKAHRVVVFDIGSGDKVASFGRRGEGEVEFGFPTSLAFDSGGDLYVVDQLNARVQILTEEGRFLDQFGGRGVGYANFVRPKDVTIDDVGFIYVSDAAFGNVQIFDADLRLLTFVGSTGDAPGQFLIASGVAVHQDRFAVVDQLGRRVQVFRFIVPKDADPDEAASAAAPVGLSPPAGSRNP